MNIFKTFSMGGRVAALYAAVTAFLYALLFGPPAFRARTCDVAFTYRMGGAFPGDVNRTHPASILPGLLDTTDTFRFYGELALFNASNGYRCIKASDQSDATGVNVAGALVRPYPTQQQSGGMSAAIGMAVPPTSGVADFLREGYIICKMKKGVTVKKGDPVWVWATATETVNIQGELQAASVASKTVPISNARFNGPADSEGYVEVEIRAN